MTSFRFTSHIQLNEYKSKMETTVSELQTQLTQSQGKVSRLHDDNKRLRDQLTEKESKIIQVSVRGLPGESPVVVFMVGKFVCKLESFDVRCSVTRCTLVTLAPSTVASI